MDRLAKKARLGIGEPAGEGRERRRHKDIRRAREPEMPNTIPAQSGARGNRWGEMHK
ncbi:MAG: hypothetical protein JXB07_13055 [Anaerolineae bacterium]|nr:hypothetical protein [Anaerolineae bacterium]